MAAIKNSAISQGFVDPGSPKNAIGCYKAARQPIGCIQGYGQNFRVHLSSMKAKFSSFFSKKNVRKYNRIVQNSILNFLYNRIQLKFIKQIVECIISKELFRFLSLKAIVVAIYWRLCKLEDPGFSVARKMDGQPAILKISDDF